MKCKLTFLVFILLPFITTATCSAQETSLTSLPVDSNRISVVETTPWGIMAGENDGRLWSGPYNGIFLSKNLGNSWQKVGLENRGITDLAYSDEVIYASTYYFDNNLAGLFMSRDGGHSWVHKGNNFSASTVSAINNVVLYGGFSHGLWVSQDYGETWNQKIGDGFYGPKIFATEASDNLLLASTETTTFKSTDGGMTWESIEYLTGLNIRYISILSNIVIVGTNNGTGIYISTDSGKTWAPSTQLTQHFLGPIVQTYNKTFIASNGVPADILLSENFGNVWTNLFAQLPQNESIVSMDWVYSQPSYLFIATKYSGIYKHLIPATTYNSEPFLNIPWETDKTNELIDNIYSFFDHKYPLLGYSLKKETPESANTTVNYKGIEAKQPYLYYSSHDGYDYALPFGKPILAAASGVATYKYDKWGLGNYISIDHGNGYKTTYGHLVETDLITKGAPVSVQDGDIIGRVGMTGNTTGPHLHFAVQKDKDNNGDFTNDSPDGKVDPYAWQNDSFTDPWGKYTWLDNNGTHKGTFSSYLWKIPYPIVNKYFTGATENLLLDNKQIIIESNTDEKNFTIFLEHYAKPQIPKEQKTLTYVPGTSLFANILDNFGKNLPTVLSPLKIEINYSNADLINIKENTLSIYYFNNETGLWEKIESTVDFVNKVIIGETFHLSHFAVFGEKIDATPPSTKIEITGNITNDWYSKFPQVTLTISNEVSEDDPYTTYYTLDGSNWLVYEEPFYVDLEGVVTIQFRSIDSVGNLEETQNYAVKINTLGKYTKTLVVKQAVFSTN